MPTTETTGTVDSITTEADHTTFVVHGKTFRLLTSNGNYNAHFSLLLASAINGYEITVSSLLATVGVPVAGTIEVAW
ncbi:MAG TPA: hypothetical protein VL463_05945 [Kofleriaceae bacterium]|nr:hypothetical protein [Kofleriaceae bacterium]